MMNYNNDWIIYNDCVYRVGEVDDDVTITLEKKFVEILPSVELITDPRILDVLNYLYKVNKEGLGL